MDEQICWLGWLSIIKDWLTLAVAFVGVCVACKGLKTWQRQLKGSSQFDVAKRLMLKVYQIRQDIAFCRAVCRLAPRYTQIVDGESISISEWQYISTKKDLMDRFLVVGKTFNEMEILLLEAGIVISKRVHIYFDPIKDVYSTMRAGIKGYLDAINPERNPYGDMAALTSVYLKLEGIVYAEDGDEIQVKVDSAVAEIEKFIEPYIHG